MRKLFLYGSFVILLSLSSSISYLFFTRESDTSLPFFSPVPDFLTLSKNEQVKGLSIWLPFLEPAEANDEDVPTLTAKSVLMYDVTTEKALFEKNPKEKMPMASLTKIMTAIVSLENPRADDSYVVHGYDLVGEDSMGLSPGEQLILEELLYGLMLPSGNDAAEVLASNSPFGREGFIKAMNDRAQAMGLTDTQFSNPSGLQGDGIQYTTAYDLLVITRYALEHFPLFAEIVTHPDYVLPATATHPEYYLVNETNLLTTYDGVKGVKTGYTPEAGLCLITYLDYGDHKIIGILLNSENRRMEMKELLDYSLHAVNVEPPVFRGE